MAKNEMKRESSAGGAFQPTIWNKVKSLVKTSTGEVVKSSKIGKLMIDTSLLQREKRKKLQDLGEKTYLLLRKGELRHETLEPLVPKIEELDKRIQDEELEIKAMKIGKQ